MERDIIIRDLKNYFKVSELVCPHTYQKWGERSWQFLDTNLLWCILIIRRDIAAKPMIVNNSTYTQRGLRCNKCQIVKGKASVYLSAHVLGKGIDFTVPGMTADAVRNLIKKSVGLFPCQVRLEKNVTWIHFDVLPTYGSTAKLTEFYG